MEPDPELLRPGERSIGVQGLAQAEGEIPPAVHHEDRCPVAFQAGDRRPCGREGPDRRQVPGERCIPEREHLGVDPLRVERADEACDHAGLREPLRGEGLTQIGPADRDLERSPRHPRGERVPARAAAVRHAPPADACVRDVGPIAQPGEDGSDVRDLLRPVDPDQAARLAVPASVEGEDDVALADPHRRRGRETDGPGLPEAVHEDHRRPAAARRCAVRDRQRRRDRSAVRGCDRHLLAKEGSCRPGHDEGGEECKQRDQRASEGRHGAEG